MTSDRRAIGHNRLARLSCGDVSRPLSGDPSPAHGAGVALWLPKVRLPINLESGTWKDFESDEGGGVRALVRRELSFGSLKSGGMADLGRILGKRFPQDAPESTNGIWPCPLLPLLLTNLKGRALGGLPPANGYQLERLAALVSQIEGAGGVR